MAVVAVDYGAPAMVAVVPSMEALGLLLGCASSGLIALAALVYPTAIRSTGAGWAMGMGRFKHRRGLSTL